MLAGDGTGAGVVRTAQPLSRTALPHPSRQTEGFLLLLAINVGAISVLLYNRRVQQLKAKQVNLEVFSRRLIESQEAERKRIASEIHDSLGQDLLVIRNQALMALHGNPAAVPERLQEIAATASQAIEEVRAIAYALRPYQLDRLGLTRAVESLLRKLADSSAIHVNSRLDPMDGLFSRESEVSIYRIVQEGVNNILRHSEATEASVEIRRDGEAVSITIADNGRGFALDPGKTGLGLVGITERVRLLGGASQITSGPGSGTKIAIRIRRQERNHERRSDSVDRRRSPDLSQGSYSDRLG